MWPKQSFYVSLMAKEPIVYRKIIVFTGDNRCVLGKMKSNRLCSCDGGRIMMPRIIIAQSFENRCALAHSERRVRVVKQEVINLKLYWSQMLISCSKYSIRESIWTKSFIIHDISAIVMTNRFEMVIGISVAGKLRVCVFLCVFVWSSMRSVCCKPLFLFI